LSLLKTFL